MKKILLLAVAVLTSVFAMADKIDYTSVSLVSTEINLDEEGAAVQLVIDGEVPADEQMAAMYGMLFTNVINATIAKTDDPTSEQKLAPVSMVAWGKAISLVSGEALEYNTNYTITIKMGGISTTSYWTMNDVFENKADITLNFKTLEGRTDPFIKYANFNVANYQTVNLDDSTFTGIKIAVKAMNLPTVGAYNVFQGGVRLYDLDAPEGKYTFCAVSTPIESEEIILCPKDKLAKGKNYKVVIPFESLYVHNYFDMFNEVCYFNVDSVEFYTEYEAPTADIDATCKIYSDKVTITNADAEQNTFVYILSNDYLNSGQTAEEYAIKQLNYANASMLHKGTFDAAYNEFLWGMYEGEYSVVFMGAEYDATREACYATTKPQTVLFSVDENGNVIGAEPAEIIVSLVAADSLQTEYTLNTHSTVTIDQPISAIKVTGLNQVMDEVSYGIYDMSKTTLASGVLSVNTIGYAEFAPVTLYEGNQYNVMVYSADSVYFETTVIGAAEAPEFEITTSIIAGSDTIALNTHSAVSAEGIDAIEVVFDGIIPTAAGYAIAAMEYVEGEESSSWEVDSILVSGELALSGKGYATLDEPINFEAGSKYALIINYLAGNDNGEEVYEILGSYVENVFAVSLMVNDSIEYALNDHSIVTIDEPIAAIKVTGLDQELEEVTYAIYGMDKTTITSGVLSVNTIGYAEFLVPVSLYEGNDYQLVIATQGTTIYEQNLIGAAEMPEIEIAATLNGETSINTHSEASVDAVKNFEITFDGVVPTQAGYSINSMKAVETEEGTAWEVDETLAQGALGLSGKGSAELEEWLILNAGTKYMLIVSYQTADGSNMEVNFVINGSCDDPTAINAIAAEAVADGKYLNGGKVVIVKNGVKYNVAGQIVR